MKRSCVLLALALLLGLLTACAPVGSPPATTAPQAGAKPTDVPKPAAAASPTAVPSPIASPASSPAAPTAGKPAAPVAGEVIVFAAASLTDAFKEIGSAFEAANPGSKVTFNFGASSQLRTQLEQGARADVFASADQAQMDRARQANLIDGADRVFARNRLVVIFPKNNPGQIRQLQDLAKPGLKFVTAAPEVPIGVYTQAMLDKMAQDPAYGADFKDRVNANIVSREPNVRQVVAKILLGEADGAVVYSSDVTPDVAPNLGTLEIPDQFNTLATYPIAIVRGAANRSGAEAFIAYVLSPPGQATLKKWGFITLSAPGPARPATPSESAATGPAAAPGPATQRGYADSFELVGLVDRPRRFTQADLQGYPAVTLTVAYGSGQGFEQGTFTGVRLWDLLQEAGIRVDPTRRNDRLRKYVVATGSDGYEAVFSLAELDPEFGAEVVLVAYRRDGQPLGPREGMARIVIGTDKRGGRLVSNLVRIEVRDIDSPPRSAGS